MWNQLVATKSYAWWLEITFMSLCSIRPHSSLTTVSHWRQSPVERKEWILNNVDILRAVLLQNDLFLQSIFYHKNKEDCKYFYDNFPSQKWNVMALWFCVVEFSDKIVYYKIIMLYVENQWKSYAHMHILPSAYTKTFSSYVTT